MLTMNLVKRKKLNDLYFASDPLSDRTFRDWCKKGKLPAQWVGDGWRVDLDRMTEFLGKPKSDQELADDLIIERLRAVS